MAYPDDAPRANISKVIRRYNSYMPKAHQKLPRSGPDREALREKGQFWTPDWVADAMVTYVIGRDADHVFDPAVGAGAFLLSAKREAARIGLPIRLLGTEIDPAALNEARQSGLTDNELRNIEVRDFVLDGPAVRFRAIVANPPYIRHHRISQETKQQLKVITKQITGKIFDGRTGYHIYFFVKALERLEKGGRLAFIMPADTCEGVFARSLWEWILKSFRLDAVCTFTHEATPFPHVDTNAVVFMISRHLPQTTFAWAQCKQPHSGVFKEWVRDGFPVCSNEAFESVLRTTEEGFETGLSRPPQEKHQGPILGDYIRTVRGIATGCNEFFFLTGKQVEELDIPHEYLVRAIGRTRDAQTDTVIARDIEELDTQGRPTYLLSIGNKTMEELPGALQKYLREGEERNIHRGELIKQRKPWYKMEVRTPPPFLFAYLGRRNARFIRNLAGIVPLTGFLCIYPRREHDDLEGVWRLLNHSDTISNLSRVAKSYGAGAIKVEPRALERVPLSTSALEAAGLYGT